jgi:hypothetical protein
MNCRLITVNLLAGVALVACAKAPEPAAVASDAAAAATAATEAAAPAFSRTAAPAGARLYFVGPANGATLKSPVTVVFGLAGMGIAPAGVQFEGAGHHHLLLNTEIPSDLAVPLPANDNIRHFGKGQTETTLELPPGTHTLQLVLGDHLHIPFEPIVASEKLTITVSP